MSTLFPVVNKVGYTVIQERSTTLARLRACHSPSMVAPSIPFTNQVVLNARREDKLRGVADEIKASGGDVAIAVGDVSKV